MLWTHPYPCCQSPKRGGEFSVYLGNYSSSYPLYNFHQLDGLKMECSTRLNTYALAPHHLQCKCMEAKLTYSKPGKESANSMHQTIIPIIHAVKPLEDMISTPKKRWMIYVHQSLAFCSRRWGVLPMSFWRLFSASAPKCFPITTKFSR